METKIYNCMDPANNPVPEWMRLKEQPSDAPQSDQHPDPVTEFKKNPDLFFPDFVNKS